MNELIGVTEIFDLFEISWRKSNNRLNVRVLPHGSILRKQLLKNRAKCATRFHYCTSQLLQKSLD